MRDAGVEVADTALAGEDEDGVLGLGVRVRPVLLARDQPDVVHVRRPRAHPGPHDQARVRSDDREQHVRVVAVEHPDGHLSRSVLAAGQRFVHAVVGGSGSADQVKSAVAGGDRIPGSGVDVEHRPGTEVEPLRRLDFGHRSRCPR